MRVVAAKITAALDEATAQTHVPRARHALASYDGTSSKRDDLLFWLSAVFGDNRATELLEMKPPRKGLVYCCSTIGWVTPAQRYEHRWDAYSGMD